MENNRTISISPDSVSTIPKKTILVLEKNIRRHFKISQGKFRGYNAHLENTFFQAVKQ